MLDYILFILGLVVLVSSGNLLVKGGVQIASYMHIPKMIVGLTIVSIGTSAPELFVSLKAAIKGSSDMCLGNVIGSNIANVGLVLAVTTLILPMRVGKEFIRINFPIMLAVSILLCLLFYDLTLSVLDGTLFVILLLGYIVFLVRRARKQRIVDQSIKKEKVSIWLAVVYVVVASFGLYIGSEWLVSAAQNIALSFGVSERIIGLTILAFGTSVPELATSVIAVIKKQTDISAGNILGSNIFNILCVLGITSIVKEINVSEAILSFDIYFMIGILVLLFLTTMPIYKAKIGRIGGALLLLFYMTYIGLLFIMS